MRVHKPVLALLACLLAGAATAAAWKPVPGAPELEVDLASIRQDRTRVSAWLRWWGNPPLAVTAAFPTAPPRKPHRTAQLTEFDCSRRSLRVLASTAYDSGGAPLQMSSTPGPEVAVQEEALAWAREALCELARSGGRL